MSVETVAGAACDRRDGTKRPKPAKLARSNSRRTMRLGIVIQAISRSIGVAAKRPARFEIRPPNPLAASRVMGITRAVVITGLYPQVSGCDLGLGGPRY